MARSIQAGFEVYGTGNINVTANNNTFNENNDDCFRFFTQGVLSATITNNTASNLIRPFVAIGADSMGTFTATMTGNTVSSSDNVCILAGVGNDGTTGSAAVRNNNFTTSGPTNVGFFASNNSTLCVDMTGNTLNGGAVTQSLMDTSVINSQAAGFCQIP